jgi:putative cell wall-binding protein
MSRGVCRVVSARCLVLACALFLIAPVGTIGVPPGVADAGPAMLATASFTAYPAENEIHGGGWLENDRVSILIEDPNDKESSASAFADTDEWGSFHHTARIDFEPGWEITVTDGLATKLHTVSHVRVTSASVLDDTVSGIGTPGASLTVLVFSDEDVPPSRAVTVSHETSTWSADFSKAAGPEPWNAAADIEPGTTGLVWEYDDDGDSTQIPWNVPEPLKSPHFGVDVRGDNVRGYEWPSGEEVQVTLDFHDSVVMTAAVDPQGRFSVNTGDLDIVPMHRIRVTDGMFTKSHLVTHVDVTSVDPDWDTVSGTAYPGSEVVVTIDLSFGATRTAVANDDGQWTVDFSVQSGPLPQGATYDIGLDDEGDARQFDDDGDYTVYTWHTADYLERFIIAAGADRFATAAEVSRLAYPKGSEHVIIATGRNWPDALGGAALAGALHAPILLSEPTSLPAVTAAEISRLGATDAIILGGTGAVSQGVADTLASLGLGVERIHGSDRYQTADEVALRTMHERGSSYDGHILIATGGNFPDALASAPLAAAQCWPLVLAHPADGLSASSLALIEAHVDDVIILGGIGAVPASVEGQITSITGRTVHVERLFGDNRYATAVAIADFAATDRGHTWGLVGIATGEDYPDALSGGVLQGRVGGVMLLTTPTTLHPATAVTLSEIADVIETVTFFGGDGAISPAVRDAVAQLIGE